MSEEKDDLVQHEPIAAGPVRMQLYGDEKLAHSHLLEARKQLGQLKSSYGVNERVAAGEPGGYFRSSRVLADGTRIEAFTNDGLDSVRITAPVKAEFKSDSFDAEGESHSYTPTPSDSSFTPEWPTSEQEESEKPVRDFSPYLWIGVRIVKGSEPLESFEIKYPQKWAQQLHVCVWEPTPPGEKQVILSNRNDFEPLVPPVLQYLEPEEAYPLQHWTQFIPSDFEDPRKQERGNQDFDNPLPTAIAYTDAKLVMIQPANVYGIEMRVPNYEPGKDEDVEWDIMFISDPDNDLKLADKADPSLTMEAGYEGGEYQIKVMCVGPDCHVLAPVEVEMMIIIGKDQDEQRATHRFTIAEHTNYRMGIMPLGWFKEPAPYPDHPCDACSYRAQDNGANPHGKHWWQGMAVAFVPPLQVAVPEEIFVPPVISFSREGEVDLPDTGFEPAAFHDRAAICPGCIITSVRYYQKDFMTAQIWWEYQQNPVCLGNKSVLGPFSDSPHYVTVKKINYEAAGGNVPYESLDGYALNMSDSGGDSLPQVDEYTFAWTDGIGGRCVGLDHDPWYTSVNYTELGAMMVNDTDGFNAAMQAHFGGPPPLTNFYASWKTTTTTSPNGGTSPEAFSYVSLGEYLAAPYNVHNNPDQKGEDFCTSAENWTWSVLDYDNLPPNHQK